MLLVLAVVLSGCTQQEPQERFAEALEATLEDAFRFEVVLEADQSALVGLGETAGDAAALLSGIELRGVVDGLDTEMQLIALGGTVVELRQVGSADDAAFFLRAGIVDLLGQVGLDDFDAEAALLQELSSAGAPEPVLDAVRDGFDGQWIGIAGALGDSLGSAADDAGANQAVQEARTAFGRDVRDFLDRYVEVTEFDSGVLRAGLRLGDLLRAAAGVSASLPGRRDVAPDGLETDLANLPEVVAGDVRVVDGRVEELAFDIAQAARAFGQSVDGQIVVRVRLSDHGKAGPVLPPSGVVPLESAVLDDAIAAILAALGIG